MRVITGRADYTFDFEPGEVSWNELPYLKTVLINDMGYIDFQTDNKTTDFVRLFLSAMPRSNELVEANVEFALEHIRKFRSAIEGGE